MTPDRLAEIEKRAQAAPKRPVIMSEDEPDVWEIWRQEDVQVVDAHFYNEAAATFFCEALKDIPDLLAEVRRLRALVAQMARKPCLSATFVQIGSTILLEIPCSCASCLARKEIGEGVQ